MGNHKAVATFVCITKIVYNLFKKRNVNNLYYKDMKKTLFSPEKNKRLYIGSFFTFFEEKK